MKKNLNATKLLTLALLPISFGAVMLSAATNFGQSTAAIAASYAPGYTPSSTYTFNDAATYYNGIDTSKTGDDLLSALRSLNSTKRKKTLGYKAGGTSTSSSSFVYVDYASVTGTDSNGAPYGTQISSFYTYTASSSFNKEHVWPNSRGGNKVEADVHMARPTISSENSSRGNSFYVEGKNSSSSGWDPYTAGYSIESRGEAARIMMYCMVASSDLQFSDEESLSSGAAGYAYTCGQISTILKWNLETPITQRELNRNNGAEYLQGNRNPFIDHPEWGCKIWGNFSAKTKQICANNLPDTPTGDDSSSGGSSSGETSSDTSSSETNESTSRGGCRASIAGSSIFLFVASATALGIVVKKKKDEDNKK